MGSRMSARGPVCIVGIDGAGKTTVTRRLVEELGSRDINAKYSWCRFSSRVLSLIVWVVHRVLSLRGRDMGSAAERFEEKRKLLSSRFLGRLYVWLVLVLYLPQIWFKLARRRGAVFVCDRYVHDTVVDLALDLGLDDEETWELFDRFLGWFPRAGVLIVLDIDVNVALSRKDDTPIPDLLARRRDLYIEIAGRYDGIVVDAGEGLDEVLSGVLNASSSVWGESSVGVGG